MSIPLHCPKCGDFVGSVEPMGFFMDYQEHYTSMLICPGKGKHKEGERTEKKRWFGLIRDVHVHYPETYTNSHWSEYCGPPDKGFLYLAMFGSKSSTGGLTVNHKWAWRSGLFNCYGDGWDEVEKLER